MQKANEQICVVGIGCCTAVGNDAPSTAAAVRAGIAGFAEHPNMIGRNGDPCVMAMAPVVAPDILGPQRFIDMATRAAGEACVPLCEVRNPSPLPVLIGLPELRPGFEDETGSRVIRALGLGLSNKLEIGAMRTAAKGHSAGLMAIGSASKMLRQGSSEFCLAGGIDSYIDPDTLAWLEENEQLHKPENAWGFTPGEAAAFCLLCTEATAIENGLTVCTKVGAVSTAVERNCIKTETICLGEGLTEAVSGAMRGVQRDQQIKSIYCDQNGEAYRADEFGFMLARLADRFENPSSYAAPADCWGDVGAASGPLFLVLHSAAARKRYPGGDLSLIWTSSEGGQRCAAVVAPSLQA